MLKDKNKSLWCIGVECPVKNTCFRYLKGLVEKQDKSENNFMRKCTNQKKYIRDLIATN